MRAPTHAESLAEEPVAAMMSIGTSPTNAPARMVPRKGAWEAGVDNLAIGSTVGVRKALLVRIRTRLVAKASGNPPNENIQRKVH
ncbi:hypothetical protein GCM10023065_06370 [Microbacterium laevaniformans]|nr:hypothetical protein GCM10017578_06380 [Microbacterium laevaniformans]